MARYWLAMTLAAQDDRLEEAEAELRGVLERERRVYGADDVDTLMSQYQLAGVLHRRGDLHAAADEYRAVLASCERELGPDHPVTVDARLSLATLLGESGDLQAAQAQHPAGLATGGGSLGMGDVVTNTDQQAEPQP
jgi:hypothetical protein